jgi:hypothetical protein
MKRSTQIIVVLAFCLRLSAYAAPLRWGIKVGPTLSLTKSASVINNPANLWAAKSGLFVTIPMAPWISLQPEAYFALKGVRYYSVYWRHEEPARLNYLEIPVLLNIHILPETFEAFIGPYLGLLLHSTVIDESHDWTWRENQVAKNDYGVSTGIRYHVLKFFFVEFQWNSGFRNAVYNPDSPDSGAHKNSTLSLLLGYRR